MVEQARYAFRVLLVDDDAGNRELLAELLASEGYHVAGTAAVGAQGWHWPRSSDPTWS
jgi:CheY-like chemotaxis protein